MKRCPSCGSTYTNDTLLFCLVDGAKLASVSDAQSSFDPEATLRVSPPENLLPTEAFDPNAAQTIRQLPSPATVPPRNAPRTSDHQAPPYASTSKSSNPLIVAGITAIVVLLLVIAGIGVALLLRSSSAPSNTTAVTENSNGAVNRNSTRNAASGGNENGSQSMGNSANKANTNGENRNGAKSTDAAGRAEAKVVRGTPLDEGDLSTLAREELRRLRNTVYARHGRTFDSPDLQRYFDTRPWYKPRSDYNESELTETDHANIKLIQTVENR